MAALVICKASSLQSLEKGTSQGALGVPILPVMS